MKPAQSKPIPIGKVASPGTGGRGTPSRSSKPNPSFARSVPNLQASAASSHRAGSLAAPRFGSLKTPNSFLDEMPVLELESSSAFNDDGGGGGEMARSQPRFGSLVMSMSKMKILDGEEGGSFARSLGGSNSGALMAASTTAAAAATREEEAGPILTTAQRGFKTKQQMKEEEERSFARRSDDDLDDDDEELGRFHD
ncbi:hypothetical protein BASA81_001587 [Batrachochytrium salamandrivorans]|nr:hypothetical protein BASA81_001587 [Batrachochytrium salamandrivorans]